MCGEKPDKKEFTFGTEGSPPHVRGKDSEITEQTFRDRITPACAGKSFQFRKKTCHCVDHPRMCGEKFITGCPYID